MSFSDLSENPVNPITSGCRIKSGMTVLGLFTRLSNLYLKKKINICIMNSGLNVLTVFYRKICSVVSKYLRGKTGINHVK
jgi:hypothetical protein